MSPLKDWLNLFAVSVNSAVSAAIFGSFFCHDVTNFNATNSELFRVNTFVNFRRGENKKATEEIHSFPSLTLSKHERTRNSLKTAHNIFNRVGGDSKKIHCHKSILCTKREELILPVKYNCYCPLRRECGIECVNLNSRTDCIMLAMLERMRLTYCVLPKGKALNVRV